MDQEQVERIYWTEQRKFWELHFDLFRDDVLPLILQDISYDWIDNESSMVKSLYYHMRNELSEKIGIKLISEYRIKMHDYDPDKPFKVERQHKSKNIFIDIAIKKTFHILDTTFKGIEILIECKYFKRKRKHLDKWLHDFHKWHLPRTIMEFPPRLYSLLIYTYKPNHCPSMLHEFLKQQYKKYGNKLYREDEFYDFDGYYEIVKVPNNNFQVITIQNVNGYTKCKLCPKT